MLNVSPSSFTYHDNPHAMGNTADSSLNIDELEETIIEEIIFSKEPVLGENLEQDGATDTEQANSEIEDESEASLNLEQTTVDATTQTMTSEFTVKTETCTVTQTDEF